MMNAQKPAVGEFVCSHPDCNARYQRKEHLRRHQARHLPTRAFPCSVCGQEFGRNDTLRRHLRVKHDRDEPVLRARRACSQCRASKARCEGKPICSECRRRGVRCSLQEGQSSSPDPTTTTTTTTTITTTTTPGEFPDRQKQILDKEERYVQRYFERFHPHWPFIHQGTFRIRDELPILVYSMVVIGMWLSGEEKLRVAAVEIHGRLSLGIGDDLMDKEDVTEAINNHRTWPMPRLQAILLHIMFSLLYQPQRSLGVDMKPSISGTTTESLLGNLITECRNRGMFYYPNILGQFQNIKIPQYVLVSIEEVKRFNIALYRLCTTVYGSVTMLPGEGGSLVKKISPLTADELQFPLPDNHALWDAATQEEWDSALAEMNGDGMDDIREDDWISWHSTVVQVLGGL